MAIDEDLKKEIGDWVTSDLIKYKEVALMVLASAFQYLEANSYKIVKEK